MRLALLLVCALASSAPLQCGSDQDPSLRRYETPGEALYGLAEQFHAQGNERARRETLEYLIARYPNTRHAVMAKEDLRRMGVGAEKKQSSVSGAH